MGIRFRHCLRYAAAALSVTALLTVTACGTEESTPADSNEQQTTTEQTSPITVVASINQWGALAAELGGEDVTVTSIVNTTNVDAHDFEPKTSDVAKLSKAQIVVANGAGYDSWATKSLTSSSNIVSAASVMGAVEGDNPHLWFSKDARVGMAEALTDAFSKTLPSKKAEFKKRLKLWKQSEQSMEDWADDFMKSHTDLAYAATEPVAYYLMADLGFKDSTPKGYAQSTASGGEAAPADLQSFQKIIEDRDIDLLINNTQAANEATNLITGTAGRSEVPVVKVSEQMPSDSKTLDAWINQIINSIVDAVDPDYGCDTDQDDESADGTDSDNADKTADGDDESGSSSDAGDTGSTDEKSNDSASTESDSSDGNDDKAYQGITYIRECKSSSTNTSTDENGGDSTSDDGSGTGAGKDDAQSSGEDQPDPGK
ncbi:metal ABC transporter solute-binding protein, Zn/Mn family [Bifidobacterium olomucense]|uniref:ABC transporter substrate-binding protein n=1 Tax=Bifidobacterium olomucense TaxID=2675324 RepID=A0A7Y0EXL5_9BIFI|nr:zinc ABC transporter substrate-binding protein [Bifidobacterium sp. DSM 109959]NMM98244.1 ABC transporter substrate-binding protein [Bifidobacterium sp. DSM 109959]